jgi:hypothetical protein
LLINILFWFYYSIFDLLRFEFHIFFLYGASGSWPGSWVWEINTDQHFFLFIFFFNFIVWHYFILKDWFVLFFNFFSIRSGLGHRFCGLNRLARRSIPWLHVYHDTLGWLGLIVFVFFLSKLMFPKVFFPSYHDDFPPIYLHKLFSIYWIKKHIKKACVSNFFKETNIQFTTERGSNN